MIRIAISLLTVLTFLGGCSNLDPTGPTDTGAQCVQSVAYIALLYRKEHGMLPTDLDAIVAYNGQAPTVDPWGNKIQYQVVGDGFTIKSAGPDGMLDTKDDPKAILSSPSTTPQTYQPPTQTTDKQRLQRSGVVAIFEWQYPVPPLAEPYRYAIEIYDAAY